MIEFKNVRADYGGAEILRGVELVCPDGQVTAVIGPNGCGKSTLVKAVFGLVPGMSGEIFLDGEERKSLAPRRLARLAAYLPQSRSVPSITAERMVLHGRFPYLSYPRRCRREDAEAARLALERVSATELAGRPMTELSGGQRQRVYLAMLLAQDTRTILMDEPTTFLDVSHQLELMRLSRELAAEGRAVVMVLHDLCLALRFADSLALLSDGRIELSGPPDAVFSSPALRRVFSASLGRAETPDGWRYFYQ